MNPKNISLTTVLDTSKKTRDSRRGPYEKTSAVQKDIRNSALQLFSEVGFHGTGIRQIAEKAGISLAALYHHMGSKEDLLWIMMSENIATLLKCANSELAPEMTAVEQVETLARVHITLHVTHRLLCIISDTELRSLTPEHRKAVVHLRDQYESLWKEAISTGKAAGDFSCADVEISAKALVDMCTGVVHWYQADGRVGVDQLVSMYTDLCVGALTEAPADVEGERL